MEKIAIISDIHGNLPALEAVLHDIKRRGLTRIICLGDLVGKGPSSSEVVDLIKLTCEAVVQGNWDLGITMPQELPAGLWQQQSLGDERLAYLKQLPFSIDVMLSGKHIRLFHASAQSVFHRLKREASKIERLAMFENTEMTGFPVGGDEPDIVGYGDIHIPYMLTLSNPSERGELRAGLEARRASDEEQSAELGKPIATLGEQRANAVGRNASLTEQHAKTQERSGLMLFNVGSIGVPYDGIPQACYCVIEGETDPAVQAGVTLQFVRVPYDIKRAVQMAYDMQMPESHRYELEITTGLVHLDV
ncbi:metallophosphoesterase family protein [Paenibacillus qinlingensis]|uniref:metallophosphoesterase family protein n=1 Tax=Paenibacillus qinlingensis TaxID=1837343 RepID=UPI0015653232|nr:metallophosphoesterase family protein [Paenibacillus qinlingensis]NQX61498.1 metallophosphoesterase family protein [Paenibacillus qinlingensis]